MKITNKNHVMKKFLGLSLISLVLFSCGEEQTKEFKDTVEKKGVVEVDTTDVFASDQYEFVLPRPFALAANFEEAGMTYDAERMNDVENVSNYTSKGKQLLNFGVYSTNLVYNIMNDRPQQTMKYFNTLRELADKFGMGSIFTEDDLALEIEENISDREALEDLLVDVHERSQEFLSDNDMRYLSAIQFSGAWVEGMYLASFDFVKKDPAEINMKLIDQMSLLRNTIKGLEAYPDRDEDIQNILDELNDLQDTFNNFDSVKSTEGVGFPELTAEDIQTIADKIQEIRAKIVA